MESCEVGSVPSLRSFAEATCSHERVVRCDVGDTVEALGVKYCSLVSGSVRVSGGMVDLRRSADLPGT